MIHEVLQKALKDRLELTVEQIKEVFKEFELKPVLRNSKVVGCFLVKGNEIHVAILPEYRKRWFSKKVFKDLVEELVKKYGFVKTSVVEGNDKGLDFITRIGFVKKGEDYVYAPNRLLD